MDFNESRQKKSKLNYSKGPESSKEFIIPELILELEDSSDGDENELPTNNICGALNNQERFSIQSSLGNIKGLSVDHLSMSNTVPIPLSNYDPLSMALDSQDPDIALLRDRCEAGESLISVNNEESKSAVKILPGFNESLAAETEVVEILPAFKESLILAAEVLNGSRKQLDDIAAFEDSERLNGNAITVKDNFILASYAVLMESDEESIDLRVGNASVELFPEIIVAMNLSKPKSVPLDVAESTVLDKVENVDIVLDSQQSITQDELYILEVEQDNVSVDLQVIDSEDILAENEFVEDSQNDGSHSPEFDILVLPSNPVTTSTRNDSNDHAPDEGPSVLPSNPEISFKPSPQNSLSYVSPIPGLKDVTGRQNSLGKQDVFSFPSSPVSSTPSGLSKKSKIITYSKASRTPASKTRPPSKPFIKMEQIQLSTLRKTIKPTSYEESSSTEPDNSGDEDYELTQAVASVQYSPVRKSPKSSVKKSILKSAAKGKSSRVPASRLESSPNLVEKRQKVSFVRLDKSLFRDYTFLISTKTESLGKKA